MSRVIALLTDFGTRDPYAGIMKGVIAKLNPEARVVDLTHEITPQNVRQAAFSLAAAVPYFPDDTVFLCVVDPGVGTERAALVVSCGPFWFVAPDNGLLTQVFELWPPRAAWWLNRPEWFLPQVSQTFNGRDLFAPVAAHLAAGVPPERMGDPIAVDRLVRLHIFEPTLDARGAEAHVIYVDRFGNLITSLQPAHALGRDVAEAIVGEVHAPLCSSYQEVSDGEYLCIWGSFDRLEVSRSMGNAAASLGFDVGDTIHVRLSPP